MPYDDDWRRAEQILQREVDDMASSSRAKAALEEMGRRYPMARADVESRVYARAAESWMELSARFLVPVRTARQVKDELTRRVLTALEAEGIRVASPTREVTLRFSDDPRRPTS